MTLSKRLQAVADMVTPGYVVADIGTDHGYIPIYLTKNKIAPKAYAMDINKGPIDRATENIHMKNCRIRLKQFSQMEWKNLSRAWFSRLLSQEWVENL